MKKLSLCLLLLVNYFLCHSQAKNVDLSKIVTLPQAETFVDANPNLEAEIISITQGQDLGEIPPNIFNHKPGYTFQIGEYEYKIVNASSLPSFRVSYIYLDGNKYSKAEIDKTRQQIISKYKAGTSFLQLVKKYNMDGNKTGDTNWFREGMMVKEFENAVKSHKKGDIFTVDTPEQNWYHVVLKTYQDIQTKRLDILKVKSGH